MTTFTRFLAIGTLLFGLALGAAGPSWGVSQARLSGKVTDAAGEPLGGVTIVVTAEEVSSYRLEEATTSKGAYAVTVNDSALLYTFRFTKDGYQPLEHMERLAAGASMKRDFVLQDVSAAQAAASTATSVFNQGAVAAAAKDFATAEAKFREAVELDPKLAPGWAALAEIYLQQSRVAEAAAMADKAVEVDPTRAASLRLRYEAWRQAGDPAKAAEAEAALAALDPKGMVIVLLNQGIEAFNASDIATATTALEQAIALDPTNVKGLFTLGLCYVSAGESAKAKDTFTKYLEVAPADDPDLATAKEMLEYL